MFISVNEALYIIALALQIAGALILVDFFVFKAKRKNILKEFVEEDRNCDLGEIIDEGTQFDICKDEIRKYATKMYKNIIASLYILGGYLLSIFGIEKADNKNIVCFCIVIFSILFLMGGILLSKIIAKINFSHDCSVVSKKNGGIEVVEDNGREL